MKEVRILLTATGSGGHILPALYIAKALEVESKKLNQEIKIEFIGTGRPLEKKLITEYPLNIFEIVGVKNLGLKGLIKFLAKLPSAFLKVWKFISDFKPDYVVGVGGYGSVLPVVIASLRGIPTWIHEAEISPGMANKFLTKFANYVSVGFENCKIKHKNIVFSGHPLRAEILQLQPKSKITHNARKLLILGGSQGARDIDQAIISLIPFLKENNFELIHQSRKEDLEKIKAAYQENDFPAQVFSFIDDMPKVYTWAEIIISRSGAGSVMEIAHLNCPAIFVPLPTSTAGHQLNNAKYLADISKAVIVEQGNEFQTKLKAALSNISELKNYNKIIEIIGRKRPTDSASLIAKQILKNLE